MEDYQGNIWLTSSRYGVLKLSANRFSNLFDKVGAVNSVVNAVMEYDDKFYCGTDNGLVIIEKSGDIISDELTEILEGARIRCLMVDSSNQLWISSYSEQGLIRYDVSGAAEVLNMAGKSTTSDRFRCTVELQDGTVVAGTSDGINFIRGDEVTDTITAAEDNLPNSQILSMVQDEDGTLLAGSDGGGIYLIRDGVVEDIYTVEDGLSSNVILRIVPFKDGFFVVTSNCLCYMKDGDIKPLRSFSYFNNYDVIVDEGRVYVFSSAGIYVADGRQVIADNDYQYELRGTSDGLFAGLTANAWNYTDSEGRLFLCSKQRCYDLR